MGAVPDARPEQRVPGGVELDLVDAVAEAVVRAELRRVLVREPRPLGGLAREQSSPSEVARSTAQAAPSRSSASTSGRFSREQVVAGERRRLVQRPGSGAGPGGDPHRLMVILSWCGCC